MRPHRRQPTRLPCPWDSLGKNTGVGCHFLLQCMKVKSESDVWLLATPWTAAYQAPPSMGFSRQKYWSRVPLPSPYWCTVIFNCGFVLHFLDDKWRCLLVICTEALIKLFDPIFKIGLSFLLFHCRHYLYILYTGPLTDKCVSNTSWSVVSVFSFIKVTFEEQKNF